MGNYQLLITVDCGITNVDDIAFLNEHGIDSIILDHHQVPEVVPSAHSIINPQYHYDASEKNMAACVVAFLFVYGYFFYHSEFYNKCYFIAAQQEKFYFRNLLMVSSQEDAFDLTSRFESNNPNHAEFSPQFFIFALNFVNELLMGAIPQLKIA